MSKDANNPQRGPSAARDSSQEATVALISAIQDFTKARTSYPEGLRAQQEHFAATLPSTEGRLVELLTDQLGEAERRALLDALCAVEGLLPPQEPDDLDDPSDW